MVLSSSASPQLLLLSCLVAVQLFQTCWSNCRNLSGGKNSVIWFHFKSFDFQSQGILRLPSHSALTSGELTLSISRTISRSSLFFCPLPVPCFPFPRLFGALFYLPTREVAKWDRVSAIHLVSATLLTAVPTCLIYLLCEGRVSSPLVALMSVFWMHPDICTTLFPQVTLLYALYHQLVLLW